MMLVILPDVLNKTNFLRDPCFVKDYSPPLYWFWYLVEGEHCNIYFVSTKISKMRVLFEEVVSLHKGHS